jgi:hypothetical protein
MTRAQCAICNGTPTLETCLRCSRPLCVRHQHGHARRCRYCEAEYREQRENASAIGWTALAGYGPIAASLYLFASGAVGIGALLFFFGPLLGLTVRAIQRSEAHRRQRFLRERLHPLPEARLLRAAPHPTEPEL